MTNDPPDGARELAGSRTSGVARSGDYLTPIAKHTRTRKRLIAPLSRIPNLRTMSWLSDRLLDSLWVALLVTSLDRNVALDAIRAAATRVLKDREKYAKFDGTHTSIAGLDKALAIDVFGPMMEVEAVRRALAPLALVESLPDRDLWIGTFGLKPLDDSLPRLQQAVLACAAHQSPSATDCRWSKLLFFAAGGNVYMPGGSEELERQIVEYPRYGAIEKVAPIIRSLEARIGERPGVDTGWIERTWTQFMNDTPCAPVAAPERPPQPPRTSLEQVDAVREVVTQHFYDTMSTTAVDAGHDAAFGIALYALDTLREVTSPGNSTAILGRSATRTLAEVAITFGYLAGKSDPVVWTQYRAYGSGQAKLVWMKVEEWDGPPACVDADTLQEIANDDRWHELVDVDLGNWAGSDLRRMSEEAGMKDVYDKYYPWPSGFVHGQWGAVRASVLATCANPLHRFHRVPVEQPRPQRDAVPDAVVLVDRVLATLNGLFPGLRLLSVAAPQTEAPEVPRDAGVPKDAKEGRA